MSRLQSWGRLSREEHNTVSLNRRELEEQIELTAPGICYGMGRSYGDSCLNPGGTAWLTRNLDRLISFDSHDGILQCESGVLLEDIQRLLLPRGWLLPVTPGTQKITVGGAIANDVHGKNHHVYGTFGETVRSLTLQRTDGSLLTCSPDGENADWFKATVGGLGLTGIIIRAELRLRPVNGPWLTAETIPYQSLKDFFALSRSSESNWEHTVSWFDCLSGSQPKGIFLRANHCQKPVADISHKKRNLAFPIVPPLSLVNRLTLKPFNTAYYWLNRRKAGISTVHHEPFSYPLDAIANWNRMYGPNGFYQYQCVIPVNHSQAAITELLSVLRKHRQGSFLAVLKTFSDREPAGMLSFPRAGTTLALDFPNRGNKTLNLMKALDEVVADAGGRLYPAKDARMSAAMFLQGYPELQRFQTYRDPGISSAFSARTIDSITFPRKSCNEFA